MPNPEGLVTTVTTVTLRLAVRASNNGGTFGDMLAELIYRRDRPFDVVVGFPGRSETWGFWRDALRAATTGEPIRISGKEGDVTEVAAHGGDLVISLRGVDSEGDDTELTLVWPLRLIKDFLKVSDKIVAPGDETRQIVDLGCPEDEWR